MPPTLTYPGVYIVEEPSGVRTISPVSTSTVLFIGSCADGPINKPILCLNFADFQRSFSDNVADDPHLPRYVKLFFMNGGTQAWVMRIAHGAKTSKVTLLAEDAATQVLELTAAGAGVSGNKIRVAVDYATDQPEATFNLEVFRWGRDASGATVKQQQELWPGLSMDPASPRYAVDFLNKNSKLVVAAFPGGGKPTAQDGKSIAMQPGIHAKTNPGFIKKWDEKIGKNAGTKAPGTGPRKFQVSIGDRPSVLVDLSQVDVLSYGNPAGLETAIHAAVKKAYDDRNIAIGDTDFTVEFLELDTHDGNQASFLSIGSNKKAESVRVAPAGDNDMAGPLKMGSGQGGLEIGNYASSRPAPTGTAFDVGWKGTAIDGSEVLSLWEDVYKDVLRLSLDGKDNQPALPSGVANDGVPLYKSDHAGGEVGVSSWLQALADTVNATASQQPPGSPYPWRASVWGWRLALQRTGGVDDAISDVASSSTALKTAFTLNVRYYSVNSTMAGTFQAAGVDGKDNDGNRLEGKDYDAAFLVADREIDLFNLLSLPPEVSGSDMTPLWGPASAFCDKRRAFLLMDPPSDWTDHQTAMNKVANLRIGLVKDHSAVFYPRIQIDEGGRPTKVGAAGAIAGVMARIDTARGVWKAPAGVEADLRGVLGLERRFSDDENGTMNPHAINTLRVFPDGVVCWGSRTMAGDDGFQSEYKYIPVRRTALFIEESLYRGLKWVVFEPNAEPLWAQIRLNVGAFMNGLYRQGAFAGIKPADAYFVKCSAETTTQDDQNRGIVNIWVGFAPLKPAEFVVIHLQQMAGQIQV